MSNTVVLLRSLSGMRFVADAAMPNSAASFSIVSFSPSCPSCMYRILNPPFLPNLPACMSSRGQGDPEIKTVFFSGTPSEGEGSLPSAG